MDWQYSDHSDDETSHSFPTTSRKRSSRACDQCRKTKSKCERVSSDSAVCKSCSVAGTACTFLGPSYKRGPPKGYIHAIEQRWHQVESLLGAIIQCPDPRVQGIVADLEQDSLAREILRRVDNGPYGPSGRRSQPEGATKEDFFASILKSSESIAPSRDSARARRQSRVSREIVSSNKDNGLSVMPTKEWQDNLSNHLASSSSTHDGRNSQRRRLDSISPHARPEWKELYTMETAEEEEDLKSTTEAIGELSLDENREVRFHGRTSGLHLLEKDNRTDTRVEGGIWNLPMSRIWPASKFHKYQEENITTPPLPPIHVQDRLLELYFTYVHPMFPVLHKDGFLAEYKSSKYNAAPRSPDYSSGSPRPDSTQEVTPLLLFSIFTITARFCNDQIPDHVPGKMWEAGCDFLESARIILTQVFHNSRPSTVQSLLLLGFREIGIGSQEQAWLFTGMAIRMATDLGLNCDSSNWKSHGHSLFSPIEIETRAQIWWACYVADSYGSVYLGRPLVIKDGDFDVPLPAIEEEMDQMLWPPIEGRNNLDPTYRPVMGRTSTCWRYVTSLCVITGSIVNKIYSIRRIPHAARRVSYGELESQLDQWYIGLPETLRFETSSRRPVPPPHVLLLHMRYWGAVLLLNRAFIPNWKGSAPTARNTAEFKAFDLAQGAATHLSAVATVYRETFTMKRGPPFLTSYLLNAAVMHILTLTLRPSNVQASISFQQCMAALKDMEVVWPSAARAWELLNGVKIGSDNLPPEINFLERHKRPADAAFEQEKNSDYLQREAFKGRSSESTARTENTGVQELGTRIMAHMLGLNIPGIEASTSYYPGYEWWPRSHEIATPSSPAHHQLQQTATVDYGPRNGVGPVTNAVPEAVQSTRGPGGWIQGPVQADPLYPYPYDRFSL